jgi:hypothetical protein
MRILEGQYLAERWRPRQKQTRAQDQAFLCFILAVCWQCVLPKLTDVCLQTWPFTLPHSLFIMMGRPAVEFSLPFMMIFKEDFVEKLE